jgi:glycosyltransferase involved in cell wall biosynthesis
MRILFLGLHPPHTGGIATATFYLRKHLEELGHTILVINYDYPKRSLSGIRFFLKVIWNMNIIRKEKIDLIHAHYLVPPGLAGVILKYIMKKPLVISAHGSDVNYLGKTPLGNLLCRIVVRFSDALIANSLATQKRIRELGGDSEVIYLGVDRERFFSGNEKRDAILYVGALTKNKCVSDLLIAACGTGTIWIVGDGPEREDLERLATQMCCDCTFFGYRSDAENFMSRALVLVLPSIKEGFGLTAIEALSCGTPVIARKGSGLEEILDDRFLFETKEELRAMLREILQNEEMQKKMREEVHVVGEFDWKLTAQHTEEVYKKILVACGGRKDSYRNI